MELDNSDVKAASKALTDILKESGVGDIQQISIKQHTYGAEVYLAGGGREITAKVQYLNGKYITVKRALENFKETYNNRII
jgi:hypothetical protein